jgi:hypothetical protein
VTWYQYSDPRTVKVVTNNVDSPNNRDLKFIQANSGVVYDSSGAFRGFK